MKGIVLAGGAGTRLAPATTAVCKQLLAVYDKPMVYYPLTTLMSTGIREVLVISTPEDLEGYRRLLGDGGAWGMDIRYAVQPSPGGLAEALLIGEGFLDGDGCTLILGDNLFDAPALRESLAEAVRGAREGRATVFGVTVPDPWRFGVAVLDEEGAVKDLVEKPATYCSDLCMTGLYVYDARGPVLAGGLSRSSRGELEITDLNRAYLKDGTLRLVRLGPGDRWFDMGSPDSLLEAGLHVQEAARAGRLLGVPEAEALRQGWITMEELDRLAESLPGPYGQALRRWAWEETSNGH